VVLLSLLSAVVVTGMTAGVSRHRTGGDPLLATGLGTLR